MTEVGVFVSGGKQPHGVGIANALFSQVLWDGNKHEYTVPIAGVQPGRSSGLYNVFLPTAHGTVEVTAPGRGAGRFTMRNSDRYHEVLL